MSTNDDNEAGSLRTSRRALIAGGAGLAAAALAPRVALADDSTEKADFLFVQTADSMAYAADRFRLTLHGVSRTTLFFADRPERIAGNMSTKDFIPFWSEGTDSFLSDPPNADLSILVDGKLQEVVVTLSDPQLDGDDLHYQITLISGDMPILGENPSLFIDVIGMPMTPISYSGGRRRVYRRAYMGR